MLPTVFVRFYLVSRNWTLVIPKIFFWQC